MERAAAVADDDATDSETTSNILDLQYKAYYKYVGYSSTCIVIIYVAAVFTRLNYNMRSHDRAYSDVLSYKKDSA